MITCSVGREVKIFWAVLFCFKFSFFVILCVLCTTCCQLMYSNREYLLYSNMCACLLQHWVSMYIRVPMKSMAKMKIAFFKVLPPVFVPFAIRI